MMVSFKHTHIYRREKKKKKKKKEKGNFYKRFTYCSSLLFFLASIYSHLSQWFSISFLSSLKRTNYDIQTYNIVQRRPVSSSTMHHGGWFEHLSSKAFGPKGRQTAATRVGVGIGAKMSVEQGAIEQGAPLSQVCLSQQVPTVPSCKHII